MHVLVAANVVDSAQHFFEDWAGLAEVLVAIGTGLLAWATFRLATQTRNETAKVGEQVEVERQALLATLRPFLVPVNERMDPAAANLMLRNMGPGLAYNVRGSVYWIGTGGGAEIVPTQVPAGSLIGVALTGAGVSVTWATAKGFLLYLDATGTEWQTHFVFRVDAQDRISVDVLRVGTTEDLGEPQYNADVGWVNAPVETD